MKLSVEKREVKRKGELNKIRQEGNIPAVLYCSGKPNQNITIKGSEFLSVYRNIPKGGLSTTIFEMDIDGKSVQAIIKEIQYNLTTYNVIHLDFLQLQDDVPVKVNVPVRCAGMEDCVGIKLGGFLRQTKRSVQILCLPKDLPKEFWVDIRDLKIRQSRRAKDLEIPKGIKLLIKEEDVLAVIAKR